LTCQGEGGFSAISMGPIRGDQLYEVRHSVSATPVLYYRHATRKYEPQSQSQNTGKLGAILSSVSSV